MGSLRAAVFLVQRFDISAITESRHLTEMRNTANNEPVKSTAITLTSSRGRARSFLNVSTTHYLCWYCAKQLGPVFTSVTKNGQTLRVHGDCRAPASALVDGIAAVK
jgi:hypothetical protein